MPDQIQGKQVNLTCLKPQKPKPDECCGGGSCCPCVWDEYREKLQFWKLHHLPNNDT